MATQARDALSFPESQRQPLEPYLPTERQALGEDFHVTLTFATSLDSNVAMAPGVQTALSGSESKAMTHYLRSRHDAIMIGVGTAIADNPSLNCRLEGVGGYGSDGLQGQPRPVIVDPRGRWQFNRESKCIRLASQGKGRAPWIITHTKTDIGDERRSILEEVGGKVVKLPWWLDNWAKGMLGWRELFNTLASEGLRSVMIEGGGSVINELLLWWDFSSVIVTIAPVWLGEGGVQICPTARNEEGVRIPVGRLKDPKWLPLGEDVVLCGLPGNPTWKRPGHGEDSEP